MGTYDIYAKNKPGELIIIDQSIVTQNYAEERLGRYGLSPGFKSFDHFLDL